MVCVRHPLVKDVGDGIPGSSLQSVKRPTFLVPFWVAHSDVGKLKPLLAPVDYGVNISLRDSQPLDMQAILESINSGGTAFFVARPIRQDANDGVFDSGDATTRAYCRPEPCHACEANAQSYCGAFRSPGTRLRSSMRWRHIGRMSMSLSRWSAG